MRTTCNFTAIIHEIQHRYVNYRKTGKTRSEAIQIIRENYSQELLDEDDKIAVLIGLSLSLCKKRELIDSIATETLSYIQHTVQKQTLDNAISTYLAEVVSYLQDETLYGKEARYKKTLPYVPDWKIGDTFSHILTYPASEALGIKGWIVLFHKVGEHIDEFGIYHQLVYVSVCSPDKIPTCSKELQQLGFLCMMQMGENSEYLAQITIKSKKDEVAYDLVRIGNYPGVTMPDIHGNENPLVAMPLFGRLKKNDYWPAYEDQICRLFRKYKRTRPN